jgi:hypothetical protein
MFYVCIIKIVAVLVRGNGTLARGSNRIHNSVRPMTNNQNSMKTTEEAETESKIML